MLMKSNVLISWYSLLLRSGMDLPNDKCGISALPPEVMMIVFEFLTFFDLRTASRVCKRWNQLAFSPKYSRKMCINFSRYRVALEEIRDCQKYRNAYVSTDDGNQSAIADFLKAAPLETLTISGSLQTIDALLDDNLLSMKELTVLQVYVDENRTSTETVLRVSHPSLKSLKVHSPENTTLKINCPSLTDLNSLTQRCSTMKFVQLVIQLQQQLQSLNIEISGYQQLEMLASAELNNLKKLNCTTYRISSGLEMFLNKIVNLVELHLVSYSSHVLKVGDELGVLKKLSKFTLAGIDIDTAGFEKASYQMKELKDLKFRYCGFLPPFQSWQIVSEHFENLSIRCSNDCPVVLPHCPKLISLHLSVNKENMDEIFERACDLYPQLENLHLDAKEFRLSTSFSHIQKLKHLKELHLTGMTLEYVDWMECRATKIEKLELNCCDTDFRDWLLLVQAIGRRLKQIHLNRCNQTFETFVICKAFVELLRRKLHWCRISSKLKTRFSDEDLFGESNSEFGESDDGLER